MNHTLEDVKPGAPCTTTAAKKPARQPAGLFAIT